MNEPEQDDYTPLSEEVVHEPKCHRVDSMNPEHAICTCRPATIRTYPRGITAISRAERPTPVTAREIAALIRECKRWPAGEYSEYQGRSILEQFNVTRKADAIEQAGDAGPEFYATFTHPTRPHAEEATPLTVTVDMAPDGRALLSLDDLHPLMEAAGFEMTHPAWLTPDTLGPQADEPRDTQ